MEQIKNLLEAREKHLLQIQRLAQKDYDKKVLCAAEKELGAINKYLLNYPEKNVEKCMLELKLK